MAVMLSVWSSRSEDSYWPLFRVENSPKENWPRFNSGFNSGAISDRQLTNGVKFLVAVLSYYYNSYINPAVVNPSKTSDYYAYCLIYAAYNILYILKLPWLVFLLNNPWYPSNLIISMSFNLLSKLFLISHIFILVGENQSID